MLLVMVLVSAVSTLGGMLTYDAYRDKVYDNYVFYELYKKGYESPEARNALKLQFFIRWFLLYVVGSFTMSMVILTLIHE